MTKPAGLAPRDCVEIIRDPGYRRSCPGPSASTDAMKISDALRFIEPRFSFEFFPPRDEQSVGALFETITELRDFRPLYVSVTYGAGGSTRPLTVELVRRIKAETGIEAMAHLTCAGASEAELSEVLDQLVSAGIANVLALRGDPPKGQEQFQAAQGGFEHAHQLVRFIKNRHPQLCVGVAGYPERHLESPDFATDLARLKEKVDAGASFVITQLFFDEQDYFAFVQRARAAGITVPIVPGIMPITNLAQIKRFTAQCGAHLPARLTAQLEPVQSDPVALRRVGVQYTIGQCRRLLAGGATTLHFYTLNRSTATREILEVLVSSRSLVGL